MKSYTTGLQDAALSAYLLRFWIFNLETFDWDVLSGLSFLDTHHFIMFQKPYITRRKIYVIRLYLQEKTDKMLSAYGFYYKFLARDYNEVFTLTTFTAYGHYNIKVVFMPIEN
ncbi:hypothetical protein ACJX0J_024786, partial [Zea mays]